MLPEDFQIGRPISRRQTLGYAAMATFAAGFPASPLWVADPALAAPVAAGIERGEVTFSPLPKGEASVPEPFRLESHAFAFERQELPEISKRIARADLRFPSPIVSPIAVNNTVHCELYEPRREGRVPAVVVLHILGGDFPLARLFANNLAVHGVAALFLKMPYYGPRRDPQSPRRMITSDPKETVEGLTQAVLDIRRATAWLASRPTIDPEKLGVFGISLGGITGALAATAEPRLNNVCLLLAGGDLGRIAWESKELAKIRESWQAQGGSRDEFLALLSAVDPVRYGANVRGRRVLMMNARDDEVVPRACTEALWESFGRPDIHWYPGGHYSVAIHLLNALQRTASFFAKGE
ncbi:MAG: alpha/beta hydrolase family protein [Planctomycetota bacterium]